MIVNYKIVTHSTRTSSFPKGLEDYIYHNNITKRDVVTGLGEAVDELEQQKGEGKVVRCPPHLGPKVVDLVSCRFYVEVTDMDLKALVVPKAFMTVLAKKMKMREPHTGQKINVPIRSTKFCDYSIELQWLKGELVFFKRRKKFT